jgi:hypothetical protein
MAYLHKINRNLRIQGSKLKIAGDKLALLACLALALQTAFAQPQNSCDAVFNPSKKFCHDGGVYDLCDGMPYNPATHVCSGDVANRALCNGVQYNPLTQICENNAIRCNPAVYGSDTQGCFQFIPAYEPSYAVGSAKKQCIDDILSGVRDEIPSQLQNCPVELGKNKAKAALPFSKVPAEDLDPSKFVPKCVVSGIKERFPAADKFAGSVESFAQKAIDSAVSASGSIDAPKLLEAAKDMDGLLSSIEESLASASEDELCDESEASYAFKSEIAKEAAAAAGESGKPNYRVPIRILTFTTAVVLGVLAVSKHGDVKDYRDKYNNLQCYNYDYNGGRCLELKTKIDNNKSSRNTLGAFAVIFALGGTLTFLP